MSSQQKPQSPPTRVNNVDLLFEPTGDLEKDYCAYCEIGERNERDDVIDGIIREELDTQATPISLMSANNMSAMNAHLGATGTMNGAASTELGHSDSSPHLTQGYPSQNTIASVGPPPASVPIASPSVIRTTVNMRNLAYCLNKRDMQPLADAIPHCPSLTAVRMTGCGLTEYSYKQLVEAVYKSSSIHTLAVDMNPDGLFKDPTATKKDKNDINVYAAEYRGAHLKPSDDKEGEAAPATTKRAPPKPSRPVPKKNLAAAAALEAAERTPIPLPTGWHAALLTGIQVLSLRGNGITDAQLQPLCDLLTTNTELLSLSLWGNKVTSAGAITLAKAVAQNGKLLTLNLGHNLLDDDAVKALMATFLTRDVAFDELSKLRTKALSLIAASSSNAAAPNAASGSAQVVAPPPPPPTEIPLYPCYGDFVATTMSKAVEEGTIASIKAFGVPISTSTGAAPATKKKEAAPVGKRKGMGDGPIERPSDPFDRDVVRLYEDPSANPATANIISQQLAIATSSGSATAVQSAIVQLQQLSKFRVPGNTALAALNLSFNPGITAKGVAEALAVIETREPLPEAMYATLASAAATMDFQPASPQSATANAKGAPVTPSPTIFGTPVPAAIPTAAGQAGLTAPAANASAVASQLQAAIMGAPHLHCLNQTRHYMVHGCALRQLDIESSKIDTAVLQQLQKALRDRRAFIEEARAAAAAAEEHQ